MNIKAYPDKDSIKVGDTIWFEINEPTTLKDGQTGNMIDYSGAANLSTPVSFSQLSDSQFKISAVSKFKFIHLKGSHVGGIDPALYREYVFSEQNRFYSLVIGIVPKEAGVFSVLFGHAANVYRKKDECTKASFFFYFNKDTDQHYYLNPFYNGDTTIVGGDYYFKVY